MAPDEDEQDPLGGRPLRERFENATDKIPEGPLGKTGNGELIGAGGFLAVEASRPVIDFIPGVKQPGYSVIGHGIEQKDGFVEHTLNIAAVSENVARFVAEYAAAPSNVDYVTAETKIVDTQLIENRRTYSSWEFTVHIDERGELE